MAEHGTRTRYVGGCRCKPCKAAQAAYMRGYTKTHNNELHAKLKRYHQENPEKLAAWGAVRWALKSGKLIKPERCERCGEKGRIHGHHEDYSKKLVVEWVCASCHKEIHS